MTRLNNRLEALERLGGIGNPTPIDTIEHHVVAPSPTGPVSTGDVYIQRVGFPGGEWVKREVGNERV